jgi:hypothetical protein
MKLKTLSHADRCALQVGSQVLLLTNELSRTHPGLNAGSLGVVVQLPTLRETAKLTLDQVSVPSRCGAFPERNSRRRFPGRRAAHGRR